MFFCASKTVWDVVFSITYFNGPERAFLRDGFDRWLRGGFGLRVAGANAFPELRDGPAAIQQAIVFGLLAEFGDALGRQEMKRVKVMIHSQPLDDLYHRRLAI
jgi:hypothetical protein